MSTDQLGYRPHNGAIAYNDRPQEIMQRNPSRVGGYIANNSDRVLSVFMGEAVELQPYRAVLLGSYQGPVRLRGQYNDRYSACEWETVK